MSCFPRVATITMALVGLFSVVEPVRAQTQGEPDNARLRIGSLAVSPTIRLINVGRDSNVFNESSEDGDPKSDMTATFIPSVEAWVRTPRVRVSGRSQLDYYYFRELRGLRAVDNDHGGRVEVVANRVLPWVAGNFTSARHRQNLEIDAIAERKNSGLQVGTEVKLTTRTSARVYVGRSRMEFKGDSLFRGTDLSRSLNHTGAQEGFAFRYAATPLTTFAVNLEQQRDRFSSSPERESDSVRITPSVEFKPLALVSGRAAVGFRRVTFLAGKQPEFKSTVASVDLQYTFRGRTQFSISALRDLEYSYIDTQLDYLLAGFNTSVTQRFGDGWDVRGTVGRYRLGYRRRELLAVTQPFPRETTLNSGVNIGYYIGRHRVGFDLHHYRRRSDVAFGRGYDRLRVSTSLTYAF